MFSQQLERSTVNEVATSKEKATCQDGGGSRRTRRSHRHGSRQRAQAVIELVAKREAFATSRTTSINVCDRPLRSYAEVALQIPEGTHYGISGENARREAQQRIRDVPTVSHRLPRRGRGRRCFRCLEKDHQVKDCLESLKCLECGHSGHRQSSCPHRTSSHRKIGDARQSATGFSTCLMGEVRGSIRTWEHILAGLQSILQEPRLLDCHRLASEDIFIQNLSRSAWLILGGWRQYLLEGGSIGWCRPRPTDGAVFSPLTCRFRASLKHKDDGQKKFIKPNSQKQDIIIKYWVRIGSIHRE